MGLRPGDVVEFEVKDGAAVLRPQRRLRARELFESLPGSRVPYRGEAAERSAVARYLAARERQSR